MLKTETLKDNFTETELNEKDLNEANQNLLEAFLWLFKEDKKQNPELYK